MYFKGLRKVENVKEKLKNDSEIWLSIDFSHDFKSPKVCFNSNKIEGKSFFANRWKIENVCLTSACMKNLCLKLASFSTKIFLLPRKTFSQKIPQRFYFFIVTGKIPRRKNLENIWQPQSSKKMLWMFFVANYYCLCNCKLNCRLICF